MYKANSDPSKKHTVIIAQADIFKYSPTMVVNAANSLMQHGGGIAAVIAKRAGNSINKACANRLAEIGGECTTTNNIVTKAYKIRSEGVEKIIHAVGPRFTDENATWLLKNTYQKALMQAISHGAEKVAFPAISAGIFGMTTKQSA